MKLITKLLLVSLVCFAGSAFADDVQVEHPVDTAPAVTEQAPVIDDAQEEAALNDLLKSLDGEDE